jgi:ubiquinone/menaquinone biosynthesis C-methylase UbiE/DNA-binding transcriptional ArsR family regulator
MGTESRLRIMQLLLSAHPDGMVVGEIQADLGISSSNLSHHLDKLKNEGLVQVKREGTFLRCTANTEALQALLTFLYAECCTRSRAIQPEKIIPNLQTGEAMSTQDIKEVVKEKYGEAALRVTNNSGGSCCGRASSDSHCADPITSNLYDTVQIEQLPDTAVLASLGCGNPTALAELKAGDVVLDLGSGGGIDVLLSAKRVGPTGKVYGLDMTDEMLVLAEENKRKAGVGNVEFLKGEIENIPLPDNSVDVIISNCVINLSANKDRVLSEAFRVLKPGGRFAVSDVVTRGEIPAEIRQNVLLWVGCVAGALEEGEYRAKLMTVGFESIEIEPTRIYQAEDAMSFLKDQGLDFEAIAPQVDGKFMSAFIRATKPVAEK